jgi:O-antigen/teichoic acid export membrane protein
MRLSSEGRSIWKHSSTYGLGSIVNRGAGLILLPVYTHVLTPAEFGLNALVVLSTEVVAVPLGMGLGHALIRFYVDARDDSERNSVAATAFLSFCALAGLFALLSYSAAYAACMVLFGNAEHRTLFALGFLALIFTALFNMELQYIRAQKNSRLYLALSAAKAALFILFNLYLVVILRLGVIGIVLGTLISSAALSLFILVDILRRTGLRFSTHRLSAMARFGLPTVPAVLLDTALSATDRYFLNLFLSPAAVGKYALAERLAAMLRWFVTSPFGQIWVVRRLETLGNNDLKESATFDRIFLGFHAVLVTVALGMVLFAPEIVQVVATAKYGETALVMPLLVLSQILFATQMHFEIGIYHAKRTEYLPVSSAVALAASIALNLMLTPLLGLLGAALASLGAMLLRLIVVWLFSMRVASLAHSFLWSGWLLVVGLGLATAWGGHSMFGAEVNAYGIFGKLALMAVFAAAMALVFTGGRLGFLSGPARAKLTDPPSTGRSAPGPG